MSEQTWQSVDDYVASLFLRDDPALEAALVDSAAAGLPSINVAPNQGRFLELLVRAHGARRALEIGTLGGYSTISIARGLGAHGALVTLELEELHARVARANLERAGVAGQVEVVVGPAAASMRRLADEGVEPFDFVFIDADKEGYPEYFDLAMQLVRPGALMVADNVVRQGKILDRDSDDPRVEGVRTFFEHVASEQRVRATVVQTVGTKGYDGFALIEVVD